LAIAVEIEPIIVPMFFYPYTKRETKNKVE
jgi:hypothetical protein